MICLRCGYCCVQYEVVILDPKEEDGVRIKHTGEHCPHLEWHGEKIAHCRIHHTEEYKDTPCDQHDQVGDRMLPVESELQSEEVKPRRNALCCSLLRGS